MKKSSNALLALLIGIVLFIPAALCAQPICQIQHFSTYSGLSQRSVTHIAQDSKGFIWFSTWNGLNKFDGYAFKNYKAYPGDGCTLTNNRLLNIEPNRHCDIWCLTYDNRVYLFDSRQEKFIDILQPIEKEQNITYTVNRVYVLPKGISWIVCAQGAFRIDEHKFRNKEQHNEAITFYSPENGNLPGTTISAILQDSEGDEWICTNKGVRIIGEKKISSDAEFKTATENNKKMYLISSDNRLAIYDLPTQQLQYQTIPYPYSSLNIIRGLGEDSISISTDNGIFFFDALKKQFTHADIRTPGQTSPEVLNIFKDNHNELWLFSHASGVTRYNPATGEKQHYQTPPENMPLAERKSRDIIFEDSQGTLWMVPHNGSLCYYDRNSKQLKPYYTDYSNPNSKFIPVILDCYLDNQKNLWFASSFEMGKISFFPNACQLAPYDYGFEMRAFFIDKQENLWTANKKGLIRIFNPDQTLKGYLTPEGKVSLQETPFSKNIYCFMEDEQGNIWLGSKYDGVFRLNKTGDRQYRIQKYTHRENDPYSLSNNSIYSIYQDSRKRIWIGTYGGGLNLLQETPTGEIRFLHSKNTLNYPKEKFNKVRIIKEVNQTLLVGTTEGLLTFSCNFTNPQDTKVYKNIRMPDAVSSLSSNDVTYIYTDSRKNTYVLTFTGGVNQILSDDLLTDHIRFKTYTKQNGLSSDLVLSMIEDQQNKLWVISENTLARFDPDSGTFDNYDEKFLQKQLYFSEAIPVKLQDQLMLGTEAGILKMTPASLNKSTYVPPIAFTGLRIQGTQQNLDIDDLRELKLKPNERNVSFQFAALDYVDPVTISYAYRLKGLEEKWNEVDNNRTANYINLPHGEYELQILSTNSDGVWVENMRTLKVTVIPTFWETYWAILFYVILFILFTTSIVYIFIYIYRLRHQINLEQQLTNIKLRFFTNISHELRTPLTLITSPVSEVLEHEPLSPEARKHLTLVHKNTSRMLRLINQILDFRKIENKKMKLLLEKMEVIALLQRVMDNFRLIAEEKNIGFRLQSDQETIYAWIDQDKFEKIVFNLLSNAFKYTPPNKDITVNVKVMEERLTVSVADEGIGIDLKKQQTLFQRFETLVNSNILQPSSGIGLSLVKELIELHQGGVQVDSRPGVGSEFIVTLPLDPKAYEGKENAEFILNDAPSIVPQHEEKAEVNGSGPERNGSDSEKKDSDPEKDNFDPEKSDSDSEKSDEEQISVLIVEDNVELRGFLNDILSATYKVIEATNGQEGLECALQYIPDFIISDIMMPVMDGLDMAKAVKENRDICHIPIILLSAKSSLDDRISGLEQGIDDYITKPFSSTYLKTRIKALLRQRKLLQELYLEQWIEKQKKSPVTFTDIEPCQPQITPFDDQFMEKVMEIMERQMDNSEVTIDEFAQEIGMGRSVFYQKLKSIVGLSPVDFIREMRIKRAAQLIESGEFNVSSIAYMTGFNDPKYFSKCFKKKYGVNPSEYKGK